ncbi:MAG TPA: exosortase/archaeosortase family protein [Myxococcota bacterium]|nr:exosortase/archaeosortase family protein [Myxococcota bacterium]
MRASDIAGLTGVAIAFAPALLAMARVWGAHEYTSHGFLVPFVAWWLFAARRRELGPPGRDPRGLASLGAAALMLAAGFALGNPTVLGLAFVLAVASLVLTAWGPRGLRRVAFPVGFLLFMVPVPPALLDPLILRLQLFVSSAAVTSLQALGFTLMREGNVVLLPGDRQLFVDQACSGITSVVTLLPLGALLAHLAARGWMRRTALLLSVVPIAMLGNWLRVVGTVAAAQRFGPERVLAGPLHESAGLLTFLFACSLLLGLVALLRVRPGPERSPV